MQPNAEPLVTEHLSALFGLLARAQVVDGPVTRGEYTLLAIVAKLETLCGPRARDLADAGGLDASTTSRRVAALVERGLLARRPDPDDGRAHRIVLTDAGRAVLDVERRRRVDLVGVALEDWTDADCAALADLLGRLHTSLARVADDLHHPVRSVAAALPAAPAAAHRERTSA